MFVKTWNILWYQLFEDVADFLEIVLMIFEIELEGTVWNSAIIDSADLQNLSPFFSWAQTSHDKFIYILL